MLNVTAMLCEHHYCISTWIHHVTAMHRNHHVPELLGTSELKCPPYHNSAFPSGFKSPPYHHIELHPKLLRAFLRHCGLCLNCCIAILQLLLMTLCRSGCLIVLGSHVITVTIVLTNMVNAATVDHVTLLCIAA